ncbi:MAG: helix-turn-helix domain-containing protein [Candidatus Saganbacteria bacterium]|nr:helix-turn-helix domain-containing protein [Candidatus Saganbacteria bacterium]
MGLYETIGHQIKKARKEQEVGQKVLASVLGYTTSTISQYESGKRYILLTDLEQIAATLNLPLTYFLAPGERSREKKKKNIYVPLKQYKMINEARKLKKKLKEAESELKKYKIKNNKLETKIQTLMARIAEQSQITAQTASLYNELKKNEEKIRRIEKIAAIQKTVEGIAYQLNNPLTTLLGFIQILISEMDNNKSQHKDLKKLERTTKRCIKIITELINSLKKNH